MKASDFLAELGKKDIRVWVEGDRLRCDAPAGVLTPDLRDQLQVRKIELMEFLRTAEAAARQQPAIVPLQPRGTKIPIYGVPGHTGDVFCFSDLVKRLEDDQPFYALQPPGLEGTREPIDTVEEIAVYFADQIRAFQPAGPVVIAGYCSGGATAFEIARILASRGVDVRLLALFGTPYPTSFRTLPRLVFNARYWVGRFFLHFWKLAKMRSIAEARRYLADRFRGRLNAMRQEDTPAGSEDPVLARRAKLKTSAMGAVRRYVPASYSGRVCLYLPNKAWERFGTHPLRWHRAAPQAEVFYGPDDCNGPLMLLEPDAPAFAELYRRTSDQGKTPTPRPHSIPARGSKPLACMAGDFSLLRTLGRAGIPAAVATSNPDSPLKWSRYCDEVVRIPGWVERPEQSLDAVVAWSRGQAEAPVLFYQGDHDLLAVSRGRRKLEGAFRFVLPAAELVEDLGDKLRFAALAERHALPVPSTLVLRRGSRVDEALLRWDRFPCVLKPSTRAPRFVQVAREQKAIRVESRAELDRLRDVVAGYDSDFLLQEAIEGGEECIESYHAYLRPGGQVVGEFTGRKLRTTPRRYGFSTYVEITDNAEVRKMGRSILEKIGFSGVVKIDFKRDPSSGRLHLLELNPRFNLWHHPGAVAGVSLPALVYQDCLEPGSAKPAGPARAGVRWMTAREDLRALREYRAAGELSTARWLVQLLTVNVNEGFMFRDPMPGLAGLGGIFKRRTGRLFGRRAAPPAAETP